MTWKLSALLAAYFPFAAIAETTVPFGDLMRDGGFVAVLLAIGKMTLGHLAKRDEQLDATVKEFLRTQREFLEVATERDRAVTAALERTDRTIERNTDAIDDLKRYVCTRDRKPVNARPDNPTV